MNPTLSLLNFLCGIQRPPVVPITQRTTFTHLGGVEVGESHHFHHLYLLFCFPIHVLSCRKEKKIHIPPKWRQYRGEYGQNPFHTWDLDGLCHLFLSVFALILTPVFLPHRRVGRGAVTSWRPAEETQRWLQDGLTVTKNTGLVNWIIHLYRHTTIFNYQWIIHSGYESNSLLTLNASGEETVSDFFSGLCHDPWNENDLCPFAFDL